jgi:hypothetical protein
MAADLFIALIATKSIVRGKVERKIGLLIAYSHFLFFIIILNTVGALNVSTDFSGNEEGRGK